MPEFLTDHVLITIWGLWLTIWWTWTDSNINAEKQRHSSTDTRGNLVGMKGLCYRCEGSQVKLIGSILSFLTIALSQEDSLYYTNGIRWNFTGLQNGCHPYLHNIRSAHLDTSDPSPWPQRRRSSQDNFELFFVASFKMLGISTCIWKRYRLKSLLMNVCFPLYPVSKWS